MCRAGRGSWQRDPGLDPGQLRASKRAPAAEADVQRLGGTPMSKRSGRRTCPRHVGDCSSRNTRSPALTASGRFVILHHQRMRI